MSVIGTGECVDDVPFRLPYGHAKGKGCGFTAYIFEIERYVAAGRRKFNRIASVREFHAAAAGTDARPK